MLPLTATFATALSSTEDAVIFRRYRGDRDALRVVLAPSFSAPRRSSKENASPMQQATLVAIVFGIAVAAPRRSGVALGWAEPYWVPEPILLLTLYILLGKRERIREEGDRHCGRAAATVPVPRSSRRLRK